MGRDIPLESLKTYCLVQTNTHKFLMQNQCVNSPLYTQNSILSFRRESAFVGIPGNLLRPNSQLTSFPAKKDNHTHKNGDGGIPVTRHADTNTRQKKSRTTDTDTHKRKMDLHPLYCKLAERGWGEIYGGISTERGGEITGIQQNNREREGGRGIYSQTSSFTLQTH